MSLIPVANNDQIVTESGSVESNCLSILFINLGTDVCTVLSYPLQQGQQLYLPGKIGTIDKSNYVVRFAGVAGRTTQLLIVRTNYTEL